MNPLVRVRAVLERLRRSLFFVPMVVIIGLVALAVALLAVDRWTGDVVPSAVRIPVASARTVLGTIATGLVAGAALVFSSILVAMQVAASQFSPRTLDEFLGARRHQVTIGLVIGTAMFCLVALLGTGVPAELGEGQVLEPHVTVLTAVGLALASLLAVVASVNRLAQSLQVERQLGRIQHETLGLVARRPEPVPVGTDQPPAVPDDAVVVTAPVSGWVQQLAVASLLDAVPAGGGIEVTACVGTYVWEGVAVARAWPAAAIDDATIDAIQGAMAIGVRRTMQEDVGFGLVRLSDVALRALSPGINDERTAVDVIERVGPVLLAIGAQGGPRRIHSGRDGAVVLTAEATFEDHLDTVVTPLRPLVARHAHAARALVAMLDRLRAELLERAAPEAAAAVGAELAALVDEVRGGPLPARDLARVLAARHA